MDDLKLYKLYLVDYYYWGCDNSPNKRKERELYIELRYPDEYLSSIMVNTKMFFDKLLFEINNNRQVYKGNIYYYFPCSRFDHIDSGCVGGWFPDKIFHLGSHNNSNISMYLLSKFFGEKFQVYTEYEEVEEYNESESCGINSDVLRIFVRGPVEEFDIMLEKNLYERLVKTLKFKINKMAF